MDNKKYIGICKIGEKGQIVIPKPARDMFNLKPGDSVVVLCDIDKGMAIVKTDFIEDATNSVLGGDK